MNKTSLSVIERLFATKKRQTAFVAVTVIVLIVALVLAAYLFAVGGFHASSNVTAFSLKNIGELATQGGYFTQVNVIDDSKKFFNWSIPFTASKYVFSYDGVIKAGIDFADVEWSANELTKTVTITMPKPRILSRELMEDSLRIYDERQSVFTPLSLTDIQESRQEMIAELEQTAEKNGLIEQAGENAKVLVTGFLASLYNPAEYTYVFE